MLDQSKSIVEQFYGVDPAQKWDRLERHRMEFAVTMCALAEWLPPAPAKILDIGGGPGRYAIGLAKRGYDVTLLDLSQASLDFAKHRAAEAGVALTGTVHGNALDLGSFASNSFDTVLLMGPLYHLFTAEDRQCAVSEAWRVLRPAGLLFAACITRFAAIKDAAICRPLWIVEERAVVDQFLKTGILRIPPVQGFTEHYAPHPTEFAPLFEEAGFHTHALIGVEGLVASIEDMVSQLHDEAWDAWVDLNYRLGHDPSLHGAAHHLLYVGHKQGRFASAIARRGTEVLLQQGQGSKDAAPGWYLPGGTIEPHETFEQGVIREVREETGIEVLSVASHAYTVHIHSHQGGTARIYEVTDWRGEINVDDPDQDTLQAVFMPVTEAITLLEQTLPFAEMSDPLVAYLRGEPTREWHYQGDDDHEVMKRI